MTLDFKKLIINSVKKQNKIQHFECNTQIFKNEELPENVKQKIQSVFGESYLEDANYTLWFSGQNITKEIVEKTIFKICNTAIGQSANNMVESDLKIIDLNAPASEMPAPEETPDDVDSMTDAGSDEANTQAIGDLVGTGDAEAGQPDDEAGSDDMTDEINQVLGDEDGDEQEVDDIDAGGETPEDPEDMADVEREVDDIDAEEPEEDPEDIGGEEEPEETDDEDAGEPEEADGMEDEEPEDLGGDDEETEDDDDDADEADDEDDEEELDESVEQPTPGEKFVFLKITMK